MSALALSAADAAEVRAAFEKFSQHLETQEFEPWSRYWAEDGVIMPPGQPRVVGRAALVEYARNYFGDLKKLTLSNWQVFGSGSTAVLSTDVDWETKSGEKPPQADKQVIVAQKGDGENWQWKIIIFNAGV